MADVPSPLSSGRLRRIIVAYGVNRLGTWIGTVALMLAVFDHTHSALAVAALLAASQAVPAFLVPPVVARVEASARRSELSGLYLFEALATSVLAIMLWHFWLPAILVFAALDGIAALAASSLLRAALARTARDETERNWQPTDGGSERLAEAIHGAEREANALVNVAFSVTFVLGPVVGGAVVAASGAPAALFIDVVSFAICAILLIRLHPHVEEAGADSVRSRLRAAWAHIANAPTLRGLLLAEAASLVFLESAAPIEVTYAKATLHAGDGGFGILLTTWGLGAVLGSVVFTRSSRRPLGALLSAGALAMGLASVGFAVAPSLAIACLPALVGGIGNGVELPALNSLVQRLTPNALHGRVMGAVESLNSVCVAVGLPLGGALVALSSTRVAFAIVGSGGTIAALALLRVTRTRSREATNGDGQAPTQREPASQLR